MTVKKVPEKFRTSDGSDFATQKEAERHEERITAIRDFDTARRKLAQAIARSQKTADGALFDFGSRTYWYVTQKYKHMPTMFSVQFWGWYSMRFRYVKTIGEWQFAEDSRSESSETYFAVDSLYASKENAIAALKQAQAEYIEQCREEMNQEPTA